MRLKIELSQLKNILSTMYFHNEGVEEDKKYWVLFKERFPNLEKFWRQFIVPATKRIEDVRDPKERTCLGTGVQKEITRIVSLHYSVFLALVYCYDHLQPIRDNAINMKEQMISDIVAREMIFNKLWVKPINDMEKLFEGRNEILQQKYNIDLL